MTQQQQGRKGGLGHPKHPKTSLNNCVVIDLHSHSPAGGLQKTNFTLNQKGALIIHNGTCALICMFMLQLTISGSLF